MATTTPNYGWPVPTSTDYVKDGATAIETLGDAIDATVFGLSKVETVLSSGTFSAVSSVTLTNVLSDTYKFYYLYMDVTGAAGGNAVNLQWRENTTTKTSGYEAGQISINRAGAVANRNSASGGSTFTLMLSSTGGSTLGLYIGRKSAVQGNVTNMNWDNQDQLSTVGVMNNQSMTNFTGLVISSATNLTGSYILTGIKA